MRLKNILLVVEDIEKSIAFYKELFGLLVLKCFDGNVILAEGLVLQDRKPLLRSFLRYGELMMSRYFQQVCLVWMNS